MDNTETKQHLEYILANGNSFQKTVISKCISSVHYDVCKKNEPINRKIFDDYKSRIERVFSHGTNEQVSSLLGSLLVQEQNVAGNQTNS
jgi:hypothetical protein